MGSRYPQVQCFRPGTRSTGMAAVRSRRYAARRWCGRDKGEGTFAHQ